MNFFKGLIDLLNALGKTGGAGNSQDSSSGLPEANNTLKSILQAVKDLKSRPLLLGRNRPADPLPKSMPLLPRQEKSESQQPVFETVQPPANIPPPQPIRPTKESFADAMARFKASPPDNLQPINPPPPVPNHPDFDKFKKHEPQAVPPAPLNYQPPTVNVPPPSVTVNPPGQPQQQSAAPDIGRLAGVVSSFIDGLKNLIGKIRGTQSPVQPPPQFNPPRTQPRSTRQPLPKPESDRGPLPKMPERIQPSKPVVPGNKGQGNLPGNQKAGQGLFSKMKGFFDGTSKAGAGAAGKAAGAAGGMMGGLAGAAAKLAGPVGLIVSLGSAAAGAAKKLFDFASGVNESNREISKFSGSMASAFAQLDIQDLQRNMRLAQNTQGTGTAVADEMNSLKDDTQAMREMMTTFKNTFALGSLKLLRAANIIIEHLPEIQALRWVAEQIEQNTQPEDGQVTPTQEAIRELGSGRWRSEGQQGLFEDF